MKFFRSQYFGPLLVLLLIVLAYYQFFIFGKIPIPSDTLVGAYFPWLDYKWGYVAGVPVKNALISDVFSQFFVWKYLIIDIFKAGEIPLWNIYSFSGTPLLATYHSTVFLPFMALLFLPKYYGWGLFIFAQTLIAALGMYFLLGIYIKNIPARISGALVFSMSGLMTTWLEFGTGVYAASFLPWIFYFLEKYFRDFKFRHLFFLSFALVCLYLSGHTQITLYSSILFCVFLVYKYFELKDLRRILIPVLFLVLSIVVCAIQFLPTLELVQKSIRSAEAYTTSFDYGLNPWYEMVRIFAADYFGNPATHNHFDKISYHEQSLFLGTLTLPLIFPFFYKRFRKKIIGFWGGVFLVALFLGFKSPITEAFYSLPLPLLTYSSAARIFFILSLSAGILVGFAVDMISDSEYLKQVRKSSALLLFIVLSLISILYFSARSVEDFDVTRNYMISVRNLVIPLGLLLISLLVLTIKKIPRNIVLFLIMFILFFDLARYFLKYNPFVEQAIIFPKTPVLEFVENQEGLFRIARADEEILPPNSWVQYKFQSVEGYDPLYLEDYGLFFNRVNGFPTQNTASRYSELKHLPSKFLDALNVKYIFAVKKNEKGDIKGENIDENLSVYKKVFEDQNTVVLENPNVLQRAYFVSQVSSYSEKQKLREKMGEEDFDPTKEALVLTDREFKVGSSSGEIEIDDYGANKINFRTRTKEDSFLVFADSYESGWQIKEDGGESEIYQVNGSLRGVLVPSGEHKFEMYYMPEPFLNGLKVSGISMIGFLTVFIYSYKKKYL